MAMKLVTAEEMRRIDATTIEERGVAGLELMERAGRAVAEVVVRQFENARVGVVTGKGNNAGDGLVVARLLAERGNPVRLLMLADADTLSEAGRENYARLPETVEIVDRSHTPILEAELADCGVIVDAVLGTGVKGPVRGSLGEAIALLNALDKPVVAIDVPSGLDADTGKAEGACVRAGLTVTIGLPKLGLVVGDGPKYSGDVEVVDIGFPQDLTQSGALKRHLLELDDASFVLPDRPFDGHKGTFGSLFVLSGSAGMSGAAYLTTAAALRSGCGMVYAGFPEEIGHLVAPMLVEAVKVPIAGGRGRHLAHDAWDDIEPFLDKADAVAVGPGIGTHADTARLMDEIVCCDLPMVLDADALNCLENRVYYLTERKAPTIITPHPGEMARLVGKSVADIQSDRIGAALALAQEAEIVVLLKGAGTVIAEPGGRVFINPTGNNGMAKGGMGDVLTGLVGGLLAQGCVALDAACAGAYLHGMAGDFAEADLGARGMTARDVLERLPSVLDAADPFAAD